MVMVKVMQKPNEPIVLENTIITHVQDQCLPTPCLVRAVLHLSPRLRFSIDSDEFPLILQRFTYEPFCISLKSGGRIKVRIGSYDHNKVFEHGFKGSLYPVQSPCTVAQPDVLLRSVQFSVLNFKTFYGTQNKHIKVDGIYRRLGFAKLEADRWQIDIKENLRLAEDRKILKQEGGYAITHNGAINCLNNGVFSVEEAVNLLGGLRAFLSFARGAACGLTLVKAIDEKGEELSITWGSNYVEPWNENRHSWLAQFDGGDSLSEAFPEFWKLFAEKEEKGWNDTIRRAIDWYLNSNNSAIHVGVVLAQAALESLSYRINQKKVEPIAKALKMALKEVGIDDGIPSHCLHLKELAERNNWTHGPKAITKIRNDIVHAENQYGCIRVEAHLDAWHLSLWYIELILLRKFEYDGRYKNLLIVGGEDPFDHVPWADGHLEAKTTE